MRFVVCVENLRDCANRTSLATLSAVMSSDDRLQLFCSSTAIYGWVRASVMHSPRGVPEMGTPQVTGDAPKFFGDAHGDAPPVELAMTEDIIQTCSIFWGRSMGTGDAPRIFGDAPTWGVPCCA